MNENERETERGIFILVIFVYHNSRNNENNRKKHTTFAELLDIPNETFRGFSQL